MCKEIDVHTILNLPDLKDMILNLPDLNNSYLLVTY